MEQWLNVNVLYKHHDWHNSLWSHKRKKKKKILPWRWHFGQNHPSDWAARVRFFAPLYRLQEKKTTIMYHNTVFHEELQKIK